MDIDLCARTTRLWAMRGHPLTVVTPGYNKKRTVFGATSHTGKFYYSIRARKTAKEFLGFLKGLFGRVINKGQKVLLIMDSYSIHRAMKVREFVESLKGQLPFCPNTVRKTIHKRVFGLWFSVRLCIIATTLQ